MEIRQWRSSRFTTVFNGDISAKLRVLLVEMEAHMQGEKTFIEKDHMNILSTICVGKRDVHGAPFNAPFTDISHVVDMIKNANIHCQIGDANTADMDGIGGVEFGLAVYVHSFPNEILSVWVFFAAFRF